MYVSSPVGEDAYCFVSLTLSLVILAAALLHCTLPARWLVIRVRHVPLFPRRHVSTITDDTVIISNNSALFLMCFIFLLLATGLVVYSGLVLKLPKREWQQPLQDYLLVIFILIPRSLIAYEVLPRIFLTRPMLTPAQSILLWYISPNCRRRLWALWSIGTVSIVILSM